MNIIIFSDLHLNKFPYSNITKDGDNELLLAGLNIIDQVYSTAVELGARLIIFCGDMFHIRTKLDSEIYSDLLYKKLYAYFGSANPSGIQLILIPGNHDQIDKTGRHVLAPYSQIYRVTVVDKFFKRGNIIICPHQYDNDKLYAFLRDNSDENSLVFMHQLILNSPVMSGAIFRKNEAIDISKFSYKMLFSGHNHRPFENKALRVYNVGSPMHIDFGDAECPDRFMIHYCNGEVTWLKTVFPMFAMAGTDNAMIAEYVRKQSKVVNELTQRTSIEWTDDTTDILKAYIESEAKENTELPKDVLLNRGLELLNPIN